MVLYTVVLRFLKLVLFGMGRAGAVRCGFISGAVAFAPVLMLVAVPAVKAQGGLFKRVSADRPVPAGQMNVEARQAMHHEEAWTLLAPHLPDRVKATSAELETAGDVLRARRFPEDAIDYYVDALQKGGNQPRLLNKLGVTELGLRNSGLARAYLKLAVKRDKKSADAWNNLGATEYVDGHYMPAVSAYRKALKLNPKSAVFHANLGTALVEEKDFDGARVEFSTALDLDPEIASHHESMAGISAHVLSAEDRAQYCFQMAKVYASRGKIDEMLNSLAMASETGMDLRDKMANDPILGAYRKDARVLLLIQNAKALRRSTVASAAGPAPALPVAAQN